MKVPRILYCQGGKEDNLGAGLLLYVDITPLVGHVILYPDILTMQERLSKNEPVAYAIVTGYSIVVIYSGILGRGNRIDPTQIDHVKQVMREMADWYYQNRIFPHLPRFKRYLL